jgi:hypothetical protein
MLPDHPGDNFDSTIFVYKMLYLLKKMHHGLLGGLRTFILLTH